MGVVRVGCAKSVTDTEIVLLGYGRIRRAETAKHRAAHDNWDAYWVPRHSIIELDSGEVVDTRFCWWAPEKKFKALVARYIREGKSITTDGAALKPAVTKTAPEGTRTEEAYAYTRSEPCQPNRRAKTSHAGIRISGCASKRQRRIGSCSPSTTDSSEPTCP